MDHVDLCRFGIKSKQEGIERTSHVSMVVRIFHELMRANTIIVR